MDIKYKDFKDNGVEIEYRREYNCENNGCDYEDICRCSYITEQSIESIDMTSVVNQIYYILFDKSLPSKRNIILDKLLFDIDKDINIYTIDRIARNCKLYLPESWKINIYSGYYGQEIDSVVLNSEVYYDFESKLEMAFSLGLKERIEYILSLEYGYILPELENKNYKIVNINKSDIIFGNEEYLNKVSKKYLEHYSDVNYSGIRGIVFEKSGKYKLIDGYHRCSSTNKEKVLVLEAYL
jgi:hypothetical protein